MSALAIDIGWGTILSIKTVVILAVIPAGASQRIENIGDVDLEFYCLCVPRFHPASYVNLEG